jgi:hypothetical protein
VSGTLDKIRRVDSVDDTSIEDTTLCGTSPNHNKRRGDTHYGTNTDELIKYTGDSAALATGSCLCTIEIPRACSAEPIC